jgi:hypothetical protein
VLRRARIAITPMRMAHIAMHAELEGIICSGPRRERQFTYTLAASRARRQRRLDRDEALGELATRYFQSHGPATIRDFVWWSGLTTPDAKRASEIARASSRAVDGGRTSRSTDPPPRPPRLAQADAGVSTCCRSTTSTSWHIATDSPSRTDRTTIVANGRVVGFMHALVIDGLVTGTWRTAAARPGDVDVAPLRRLTVSERQELSVVSRRYATFVALDGHAATIR